MLHRLLLWWRKFAEWMMPGPKVPAHHDLFSEPFRPSNLHSRHFR